jgi:hypothetical protein
MTLDELAITLAFNPRTCQRFIKRGSPPPQ